MSVMYLRVTGKDMYRRLTETLEKHKVWWNHKSITEFYRRNPFKTVQDNVYEHFTNWGMFLFNKLLARMYSVP
jgi:hypothetical protein